MSTASAAATDGVVVGVDIGGTGMRVVAVDREARVVSRASLPTPQTTMSGPSAVALLADAVHGVVRDRPLDGVGIGASGPVDTAGVIRNPHTLPAFTGIALGPLLGDALGVPVVVDSDAVAAAMAEAVLGAGVGAPDILHVTIGTGIGVAVVRGGRPLLGADGLQPEAGHLDVPDDSGQPCYCGRAWCWEQTASRRALQRSAGARDVAGVDALASAADRGDPVARAVFDDYGRSLGLGLRNLVATFRPSRIVIGGGGARWLATYERALIDTVSEVDHHGLVVDIRATGLDDDGGARGAALLALTPDLLDGLSAGRGS